jgi:hypothetical protein
MIREWFVNDSLKINEKFSAKKIAMNSEYNNIPTFSAYAEKDRKGLAQTPFAH